MAGMVGSSGSGVFSTAISQSPVSDWHYYGRSCDCHVKKNKLMLTQFWLNSGHEQGRISSFLEQNEDSC